MIEAGDGEVQFGKVGEFKVGVSEVGFVDHGMEKIARLQARTAEDRMVEIGASQIR